MSLLKNIFNPKALAMEITAKANNEPEQIVQRTSSVQSGGGVQDPWRYRQVLDMLDGLIHPSVVGNNFMELWKTIPEVFWPVDFIAKRISEGHYDLKRTADDSIVWCTRLGADRILKKPNPVMTWRELLYQHHVFKLVTGNSFLRAAMADTVTPDAIKFQWCSNYWVLPSPLVKVVPMQHSYGVPIFGIAEIDDLIKGYTLDINEYSGLQIPTHQIWHDRDGIPNMTSSTAFMKADSRLLAAKKPIANLIAVYEARNVIYIKRGALGFVVAQKEDPTGTVALEEEEKKALRKTLNDNYGVGEGQSPWGITDVPVNFVRTNLSISELQPFEETLEDAIKIAGVYNIPSVLVPRKDQATFSNQDAAEKAVYSSVIIPMAKRFCEALTEFLGLEKKGLYLDCDFSDVACLQVGLKEAEEVKKMVNERCMDQFNAGLISINDWRAQIHEAAIEGDVYNKVKFEMTPEEIEHVNKVVIGKGYTVTHLSGLRNNNQNTNNQPSKGEENNERTDDQPSV